MIFTYESLVKSRLANKYGTYTTEQYKQSYEDGLFRIYTMLDNYADTVSTRFIYNLLAGKGNNILLYSASTTFNINHCLGAVVYTKTRNNKTGVDRIYLYLLCIRRNHRKFGYGKICLEEFIEYIRTINARPKQIILHSLDTSRRFYETFGFTKTENKPSKYRKLFRYEQYDPNALIMTLVI